ncbi:hypothetical protein [Methylosinus sp. KRF6]|uniref:hypothetical protein n=1 Tax=Methylosinus sp. KRF6 TaxID=2846853 RepID=UPI001C0E84B5|nr:hypothetical protein [Methylosinus sp. KRF6]MBU3891015.1 hypothetical protein [Methylosinus sp. KRF6]
MRAIDRLVTAAARCMLALAAAAALSVAGAAGEGAEQNGEMEDGGTLVRWSYVPTAPGLGQLGVEIVDAASGTPLRYERGRLAAWLQRRRDMLRDSEPSCAERVKTLVEAGIGRRADIDVNGYRFVTLNGDGTSAFINPFVGLDNAKLESIVELGGTPVNWIVAPDRMEFWALLESGRLVVVDAQQRRIVRTVELPAGARARDLARDPVAPILWIAMPGLGAIGRLDMSRRDSTLVTAPSPAAGRLIAIESPAASRAPVSRPPSGVLVLQPSGEVEWRDSDGGSTSWRIDARPPTAARYSALGRRFIVAAADGQIVWIDPFGGGDIERRARLDHAIDVFALFDDGRYGLAIGAGRASVIDIASARIVADMRAPGGALRLVFTASFAYAIDAASGHATMWPLADLRAGREQPVDVIVGRADPSASADVPEGMRSAVPGADGAGLITASAADARLYQYSEGMMAPNGGFSNYGRTPLALAVLDTSLRETAPGRFTAAIRHDRGGVHDLLLAGLAPRLSACARIVLPAVDDEQALKAPRLRATLVSTTPLPGRAPIETLIRVRLREASDSGAGGAIANAPDLTLLVFDRLRGWQTRAPLRRTADGEYETQIAIPRPGRYALHAASPSRNLSFVEGAMGEAQIGAAP